MPEAMRTAEFNLPPGKKYAQSVPPSPMATSKRRSPSLRPGKWCAKEGLNRRVAEP